MASLPSVCPQNLYPAAFASRAALRTEGRQSGPAPEALIQPTPWAQVPSTACSHIRLAHRLCRVNLISSPATLSYFLALILKKKKNLQKIFRKQFSVPVPRGPVQFSPVVPVMDVLQSKVIRSQPHIPCLFLSSVFP